MTLLISKVQFKRSEKGEFHDTAPRNLNDTISLIRNYPWDTERGLASIELTCPSITIEHPIGTFLKVGPYFSGKFSIYYLNTDNRVYLKTANTLEDAGIWVKLYFEQKGKLEGFERYGFTFKTAAHFQTNAFEYIVDRKAIFGFFRFPIYIAPFFIFICWLNYLESPVNFNALAPIAVLFLFLLLSSPLIYLFLNYLSANKVSYLKISKGHDEFLYGTVDAKKSYNKLDIAEINAFGVRNSRSPWSECEVFLITFNNGEQIQFTSLLIAGETLRMKFPDHQIIDHKRFFPTVLPVIMLTL